jgi:sigma-B regulation protein RsbU (phosphoserine phosphatase)
MKCEYQFHINNDLDSVSVFAGQLNEILSGWGLSGALAFQIDLCLSEILTNIVCYGFRDNRIHDIEVQLAWSASALTITVRDDGISFDPTRSALPPDANLPLEQREPGGLGIYLVGQIIDEIDYQRHGRHNHLTLRKHLD